jgi:hypothetical protein
MKTEAEILKSLTDAFLQWRLPVTVCADGCTTRTDWPHPRYGTNLLTASEAEQMIREIVLPIIDQVDTTTIRQRDAAEDAANDLTSIILGEPIDWPDHEAKWDEAREAAHQQRFDAQWYPVAEMIPEDGKQVLLAWDYTKPNNAGVTYRTGAFWGTRGWKMSGNITPKIPPTHWREIPSLINPQTSLVGVAAK